MAGQTLYLLQSLASVACIRVLESGQLTTPELNSLIGHAHRRVDQLQRQLVEQSAMEPLRAEAALDGQRVKDERLVDEMIAEERQRFELEINRLHDAWVCFVLLSNHSLQALQLVYHPYCHCLPQC